MVLLLSLSLALLEKKGKTCQRKRYACLDSAGDWTQPSRYSPSPRKPLKNKVSRRLLPWQSALQQITKISWGSAWLFICFMPWLLLLSWGSLFVLFSNISQHCSSQRLFHMLRAHVCESQTILFSPILQSIRLNNLAYSVQILTQSLTLLSIRYLCNVYERSSWWLKPSCRSTLISSWSSHDVKSPSECLSRYRSCSIEQHRRAGCEGWGGEEDSYTL